MAKYVLLAPVCVVNGVDLSDHFSHCTIETVRDEVEVTGFGSTFKEILGGLADATITFSAFQDFAAAKVDATIWPLVGSNTGVVITVKPTSAANSATNPQYTMTGILLKYNPMDGDVGTASATDVVFRNAAGTGLTRVTV